MDYVKQNIGTISFSDIETLVKTFLKEADIDNSSYSRYAVALTNVDLTNIKWKYNYFGKIVKSLRDFNNVPTAKKIYEHLISIGFFDGGSDVLGSERLTKVFIYFNSL